MILIDKFCELTNAIDNTRYSKKDRENTASDC